jgi:hypothetical protein
MYVYANAAGWAPDEATFPHTRATAAERLPEPTRGA